MICIINEDTFIMMINSHQQKIIDSLMPLKSMVYIL